MIIYLRQITAFYRSDQQQKVFENYLKSNSLIKHAHSGYRLFRNYPLKYYFLCMYGVRTIAPFGFHKTIDSPLVAFAATSNQLKGIKHIASLSDGVMRPFFVQVFVGRIARIFNILRFLSRILSRSSREQFYKIIRIVKKTDEKEGWIVALNIASFLFSYAAFKNMFEETTRVAFTSNDFAPVPLAFKAAAQRRGLKQMFTMHGQISSAHSPNTFPRLKYDLAFLYGELALSSYMANGSPDGTVILTGFPGESVPMKKIVGKVRKIGIALSNFYDNDTEDHILNITRLYPGAMIYVKKHPGSSDIKKIPDHPHITLSAHDNILSFSRDCDFIMVGNTGAQLDTLKFGCPTAYYDGLDKLGYDDIGFVKNRIVLEQKDQSFSTDQINEFFNQDWIYRFRKCDASYLVSEQTRQEIQQKIMTHYQSLLESP